MKQLEQFNDALLAKAGWGLWIKPETLWAQILLAKYSDRREESLNLSFRSSDSWIWKACAKVWNLVSKFAVWIIRRGDRVRFWEDRWIPGYQSLRIRQGSVQELNLACRLVREFVTDIGQWN